MILCRNKGIRHRRFGLLCKTAPTSLKYFTLYQPMQYFSCVLDLSAKALRSNPGFACKQQPSAAVNVKTHKTTQTTLQVFLCWKNKDQSASGRNRLHLFTTLGLVLRWKVPSLAFPLCTRQGQAVDDSSPEARSRYLYSHLGAEGGCHHLFYHADAAAIVPKAATNERVEPRKVYRS